MNLHDFLKKTFGDNSLENWLIALGVVFAIAVILWALKKAMACRLADFAQKTTNVWDDLAVNLFKSTKLFFILAVSIYAGTAAVDLPGATASLIGTLVVIVLLIQAAIWGNRIIAFLVSYCGKRKAEKNAGSAASLKVISFIGKLVLWSAIILLALDNIGIDITTLVAGLGVGGIAVALAVQNVLGDVFASLSIMLDKPFEAGDFIIVDDLMGTVEHVGLKTTRVRSLHGEQIVFSNTDLLKSRIRNYKRMQERRIMFAIGVTYQTPHGKLAAIPSMLKEAVESQKTTRFDRAHFKEYGDFSLNFEVIYYVNSQDYNVYMDTQQGINLAIHERFEKEGIEFAYPTQTLYLQKD